MKIIAFNGSPRPDGNTAVLLNHVLEPIRAKGMTRILTTLALTVGCILLAGCKGTGNNGKATPLPASQPTSAPCDAVADAGLPEGGVTFNSKLALNLWVHIDSDVGGQWGGTPASRPISIPKCRWWGVEPLQGVSIDDTVAEAKAHGIHALLLTHASDKDIDHLGSWPELTTLFINGPDITDAALVNIGEIKGLRTLGLMRTSITDAGLVHLIALSGLQELFLEETHITDAGLAELKKMTGLQTLGLGFTKITDSGLVHLKALPELRGLDFFGANITDAGMGHLRELEGLRTLGLESTQITDVGLACISDMQLLDLHVEHTHVTLAGLLNLNGLKKLKTLNVAGLGITKAGLEELRKARPNTKVIDY